jgi:acyl-coenzyme A thioesterase PaaI-like protein
MALFANLIALTPADGGFSAHIDPTWTVGTKVHGGSMLAVCAAAARAAHLAAGGLPEQQPVVIAAEFLSAPDPGDVRLHTAVRKPGRTTSVVDVVLVQGEREYVRCSVTLAQRDTGDERYESAGPLAELPVEPTADAFGWDPDHPVGAVFKVGRVVDVRYDRSAVGFLNRGETGAPDLRGWTRLRTEPTDALFALLASDISIPVVANMGLIGWAPTLQLTAVIRRDPAPGWLRFRAHAEVVGQRWFEEDHHIMDSAGRLVATSRQLAMLPART